MKEFKVFEDMKNDIPEGATHYSDETDGDFFTWFKVGSDVTYSMMPDSKNFNSWDVCVWKNTFSRAKPIPVAPQPKRTSTECEKVTESIFDLRDEFERGELYFSEDLDDYSLCKSERDLVCSIANNNLYRKVEKEIDWKKEVKDFCGDKYSYLHINDDGHVNCLLSYDSDIDFLELCRVALRANGEIE